MARKVAGYKDKNTRRDVRSQVKNVRFVIGKVSYPVSDLSVGGFMLEGAIGDLRVGRAFTVTFVSINDGPMVRLSAPAEAVRADYAVPGLGCRFGKLTSEQFRLIESIIMHRPIEKKPKKKGFFGLFGG